MCDYSLEAYRSRPAVAGEKLTLARFPSGSMGFVGGAVCDTAVCIPAESRLLLNGIGDDIQTKHGVGAVEEAVLTRLKRGPYKDAVRFSNGTELVLQRLASGVTAVVMTHGAELDEPSRHDPAPVREREPVSAELATARAAASDRKLADLVFFCWRGIAAAARAAWAVREDANAPVRVAVTRNS